MSKIQNLEVYVLEISESEAMESEETKRWMAKGGLLHRSPYPIKIHLVIQTSSVSWEKHENWISRTIKYLKCERSGLLPIQKINQWEMITVILKIVSCWINFYPILKNQLCCMKDEACCRGTINQDLVFPLSNSILFSRARDGKLWHTTMSCTKWLEIIRNVLASIIAKS